MEQYATVAEQPGGRVQWDQGVYTESRLFMNVDVG